MRLLFFKFFVLSIILGLFSIDSYSTHLRAGYIHIKTSPFEINKVVITIHVYTDAESKVLFGMGSLDFGDGNNLVIPEIQTIQRPDLGSDIGYASFTIEHYYLNEGRYTISYTEPNRNADILNIPSSVNYAFHVQTEVVINSKLGGIDTSNPIHELIGSFQMSQKNTRAVTLKNNGSEFYLYEFGVPRSGPSQIIQGYRFPTHISLNNSTGFFSWDLTKEDPYFFPNSRLKHGDEEEFAFAIQARQFKKVEEVFYYSSTTTFDFQIIVSPYSSEIEVNGDTTRYLLLSGQINNFQRSYSAADSLYTTVETDLPEGSYDISIKNEDKTRPSVDIQLINQNTKDNGPYSIIIRNRLRGSGIIKDDLISVYFNELPEFQFSYITSVPLKNESREVVLFPNPSSGDICFSFEDYQVLNISIVDVSGKEFMNSKIFSKDQIKIPIPGIYFYSLSDNNKIIKSGKIIIN